MGGSQPLERKESRMELPTIDLADLPDLDTVTGMFGSLSDLANASSDDRVVIVMIYVYETMTPATSGLL